MEKYLFGDSDLAARRLELLAEVFRSSSWTFIVDSAKPAFRLAVDLGCGPGYTTHLLAEASQCHRVVGLDDSEYFISLAQKSATDKVSFRLHDVTFMPFPVGPCGLIYGRFLLTHQPNPEMLIAKWAEQLQLGGRLLLEEVDSIQTDIESFVAYIDIVQAMLADSGRDLYVGQELDRVYRPDGLTRCSNQVIHVPVTSHAAAKMFSMNIQTWKHNAFVQKNYSTVSIQQLEQSLLELANTAADENTIEWQLRQVVYERD